MNTDIIEGLKTATEGLTEAMDVAADAAGQLAAALAPQEPMRMERIAAGFVENRGLAMLQGKFGDKGDMYKLVSVLSPTEVHMLCSIIWGYKALNILAVYRGVATGDIVHAIT